jgi:subfamily B ATP-binding cassette protein MsbA
MSDARRLFGYLLRHRVVLVLAVIASILSSIFVGGAVGLVRDLVEALAMSSVVEGPARAGSGETPEPRAPEGEAGGVELPVPSVLERLGQSIERTWRPVRAWLLDRGYIKVPAAIVLLYLLKGAFGFLAVFGTRWVGLQAVTELREQLYVKALSQSDAFYRKHSTGEIYSRILGDVGKLQGVLENNLSQAVVAIPKLLVMLLVSLLFAWQITLVCLLVIPAFAYSAGRFGSRVKRSSRRSQERSAKMTGVVEETLTARRVVQAFGAVGREQRRFSEAVGRMLREDLKVAKAMAATPPVMELLGAFVGAALLAFSGYLIRAGALEAGDVLVAFIALFVVFSNVRRLGQLNNAVQHALAAARRAFDVLDAPVLVRDRPGAEPLPRFSRSIDLDRVSVGYGRGPVLHEVTMEIRRGEVHALVGPSGAGKSTLAMLLPRFMDPDEGAVRIDGRDLRDVTLDSLRSQIALVTQETHLFEGTIAENIAYGRQDASSEQIRRAAEAANAATFIEALDKGYEASLGDKGAGLSHGQRQRLAIARAFLRDAPILILDEATSSLDAESERLVQDALHRLLEGRTALIIAHRLKTVNRADAIHVLDRGREVERGTHPELLEQGGLYARLHALQESTAASGES